MEVYQFNPFKADEASKKEHQMMIANLRLVLAKPEGKAFVKYLMKHFGVAEYPQPGISPDLLLEYMGFCRAGESVFSIAAQAEPTITGLLLAEIQREKYNYDEREASTNEPG